MAIQKYLKVALVGSLLLESSLHAVTMKIIPPSPDIPAPSFLTKWKERTTGYKSAYGVRQTLYSDRVMAQPCPSRTMVECIRVQVEHGDSQKMTGERAELAVMLGDQYNKLQENLTSGTKYYALSVYIPSPWNPPAFNLAWGSLGTIFQLHGPDSLRANPVFALMAENKFSVNWRGGDISVNKGVTKFYLSNDVIPLNKWVDFVVGIKFAATPTGSITVWRHDQGQAAFIKVLSRNNLATLQYIGDATSVGDHYWKTGYYRSISPFTSLLYLGEEARADSPESAASAAFNKIPEFIHANWNSMF